MTTLSIRVLLGQGLVAILLGFSFALNEAPVLHEERNVVSRHTTTRQRLDGDTILPMRIGLKSNSKALSNAEAWLMNVSDPDSKHYGRFWSQEKVIESFKPASQTLDAVTNWLAAHGITRFTHSDNRLWYAFDVSARHAEQMLQTKYNQHFNEDGTVEASCKSYYLPEHLRSHIDYITPGVRGTDITDRVKATPSGRTGEC